MNSSELRSVNLKLALIYASINMLQVLIIKVFSIAKLFNCHLSVFTDVT